MKSNIVVEFSKPKALLALGLAAGALAFPPAQGQQVYRIVGPDGKTSFSDLPPPAASNGNASVGTTTRAAAASNTPAAGLPFELRQVAGKYPVTLYTSDNCAPCGSGRSLLTTRGVPFAEKTVSTTDDSQALRRISGDTSLPFLTIGGQQLKGFSDAEWSQYLDAAGYPATSILPASYRAPMAAPLVAAVAASSGASDGATANTSAAGKAPAPRPARPAVKSNDNPTGIRF